MFSYLENCDILILLRRILFKDLNHIIIIFENLIVTFGNNTGVKKSYWDTQLKHGKLK